MLKWLIFIAIGFVVYRWLSRGSAALPSGAKREAVEQMVKCAQCGVHFPLNEAVVCEGFHFCCEPHCAAWKQSR